MYCNSCGKQNPADSKFCESCGAKLPITFQEVQPTLAYQPVVQQPAQPAYYIPPSSTVPTTFSESQSKKRSFHYSNIFYVVMILDLIISFIFGLIYVFNFFDVSMSEYQNPIYIILGFVIYINFIIDIFILNNMRTSPHTIDINSCWIKCVFGFLGIVTFISGLYFLIISIKMSRV